MVQHPSWQVLVNDVPTTVLSWETNHALDQIGSCSFVVEAPPAEHIVDNATIEVKAAADSGDPLVTVFKGSLRADDRDFGEGGRLATMKASGALHLMEFPNNRDVVYAGGASTSPVAAGSPARHVGPTTIAWYAQPSPFDPLIHDITWTPAVDSSFVIIAGRAHGTNDWATSYDGEITNWTRCEIWQDGRRLGYANMPVLSEDYDDALDYTNDANWEDFSLTIAARIRVADGDVTRRFAAGRKPGTSLRDDFEIKSVTRQTAGKVTARQAIRGLFRRRGFSSYGIAYEVDEITSISGVLIELGGNGFVDNGQVRIEAAESFFGWIQQKANLFGYHVFDSPDAVCRVKAVRGTPPESATLASVFTEGYDALSFRRTRDLKPTINYWRVLGASGTDQDGLKFQYLSEPDPDELPDNPNVPDPPGFAAAELSDSILVSDDLCLYVRHVQEINTQDGSTEVEWETWGNLHLQPANVVLVEAPSVGVSGRLWLTGIRRRGDEGGLWTTLTGWTGAGDPLPEGEDPDPDEDDLEPSLAPPTEQWRPYEPRSVGVTG